MLAAKIEADQVAVKPIDLGSAPPATSILHCSFCHKTQHEVRKLIAGPNVFICDECVGLCDDIVAEKHRVLAPDDPAFYIGAPEALSTKSAEELIALKTKAEARISNLREFLRKTPQARPGLTAAVGQQMTGLERVAETVTRLLGERGRSPGSAE